MSIVESKHQVVREKSGKFRGHGKIVTFADTEPQIGAETMEEDQRNLTTEQSATIDDVRQFDLIIFAASGSVGKFLVEELALVIEKQFNNQQPNSSPPSSSSQQQQQFAQQALRRRSVPSSSMSDSELKWAVAGRSAIKLSETLCRAELSTGIKDLSSSIRVVLADLNHQKSLLNMCRKTKLIINCAGPYSELGAEMLIQACIECKTNYIDLAHEVTFIETMRKKYSDKSKEASVFILNGCGFQSMSAEMGLNFTKQVADGTIDQIKIILSMSDTSALIKTPSKRQRAGGIISEGMWNSLLADKAQETSIESRFENRASISESSAYQMLQEQQVQEELEEEKRRLLGTGRSGKEKLSSSSSSSKSQASTSEEKKKTSNLASSISNRTKSLTARILERKDTQSLVKDIVQFRNRNVSLAWPLRLIQGFQGKRGRGYCWPIDSMSSDESQLIRSEMSNYELRRPDLDFNEGWRPIRCSTFLSVKNFTQLSLLFVWLFFFQILVKFSLFRYAMRRFPQLVTLGHVVCSPSGCASGVGGGGGGGLGLFQQLSNMGQAQTIERDSLSHIKFCQTFIAYGTPNDESRDPLESCHEHSSRKQVQLLVSRVVGPEPNHVATATFAIQAAITLLFERDHMPSSGGVLTPGSAFSETNIIYQLRKRNIKFEVLKKA